MRAILLIAHGSRRAEANADLEHVAQGLRDRGEIAAIICSYLELAAPTIEEGGSACVECGATEVVMLPYFLSPGVHVREDLLTAQNALAVRFPTVTFHLAEPLGRHPLLLDVVEARIRETLPPPLRFGEGAEG